MKNPTPRRGIAKTGRRADSSAPAAVPRSLEVVFQVLETVAEFQPIGVSDLARRLKLPKSTVQRALRALHGLQYVYASGDSTRWSLTLRAFHVGSRASPLNLRDVALPEMEQLLARTQEAVHLTVLDGRNVVVIEKLDSVQAVRAYTERGSALPAHSSATGKALLAASPASVIEDFLSEPLSRLTSATIVSPTKFRAELDRIRKRGFSTNLGERRLDVIAVGTIIRDVAGNPVAGLGISAPRERFTKHVQDRVARLVMASAETISHRLGWRPPADEGTNSVQG